MNFLEVDIAKMERRLQKIRDNPDPRRPKSNALLYEAQRDRSRFQLEGWQKGELFAGGGGYTARLMFAMGFHYVIMTGASMHAIEMGPTYLDLARAQGLPRHACDVTIVPVGMVLAGDLPRPNIVVAGNYACDTQLGAFQAAAHLFNVPVVTIDTPVEDNEDSLQYIVRQLEEIIEFAESKFPGAIKYDESKLKEMQEMDRIAGGYYSDVYQLMKRVPCPISGKETFRTPHFPSGYYPHMEKCLNFVRTYRDELMERADRGIGVIAEERLRMMWTVSGPYFWDPFAVLYEEGVSVPFYYNGGTPRHYGLPIGPYSGEKFLGRKLSPLEWEASILGRALWAGRGRRWVDNALFMCRDLKIDAIINYQQSGCTATLGLAGLLANAAERELGIPTLQLPGRQLDPAYADPEESSHALREFVEFCLRRKAAA